MSILKDRTGEVRLIWRILLIIILSVTVAVILRFIPISLYTAFLTSSGIAQEDALESAKDIIFHDPLWSTVIGIINGFISLLIVWFLIKVIERRSFTLMTVGLNWRSNSMWALAFGVMLALIFYIANIVIGPIFGSSIPNLRIILSGVSIPIFIHRLVLYISMGIGEEVVFRGYLQTRLVERYGAYWGILIASIIFTLVHLGFISLSPITIISGVLLWATIGALYHWSKSIYLVGIFHGMTNTLLNTMKFEGVELGGLIVHALALFLVIVISVLRSRASGVRSNPQ